MAQQINIGVWHRDLASVFEAGKVGPGVVALLQLMNLQLGGAHEMVGGLSDDAYVQRGLKSWRDDYAAVNGRLGWYLARLKEIVDRGATDATRAIDLWTLIARPVLQGEFRKDIVDDLRTKRLLRGITVRTDGSGKSFGDAIAAATLWNQAAAVYEHDAHLGTGWATNIYRSWLTETARQLERSAPGEDATLADRTIEVLRDLADAPKLLFEIPGLSTLAWGLGIGVAAVAVLALSRR